MKKLILKNLKLEATDLLQRNQLKTVFGGYGGYGGSSCGAGLPECPSGKGHCCCDLDGNIYLGCKTVQDCWNAC